MFCTNMALTNVQIRIDASLKKEAEGVLDKIGLDMPTAFRIFLKKVVATRSIPFPLADQEASPPLSPPAPAQVPVETTGSETAGKTEETDSFLRVEDIQEHLDILKI
jgi:addiction module RelB/DinJ family antitoxin